MLISLKISLNIRGWLSTSPVRAVSLNYSLVVCRYLILPSSSIGIVMRFYIIMAIPKVEYKNYRHFFVTIYFFTDHSRLLIRAQTDSRIVLSLVAHAFTQIKFSFIVNFLFLTTFHVSSFNIINPKCSIEFVLFLMLHRSRRELSSRSLPDQFVETEPIMYNIFMYIYNIVMYNI